MRPSQTQRLFALEKERTSWRHGFRARVWQLKWGTCLMLACYLLSCYYLWRHPRPSSHVWIDEVLVEVLEDGWGDKFSAFFFYAFAFLGTLLLIHMLCGRPERRSHPHRRAATWNGTGVDMTANSFFDDRLSFDHSSVRPIPREEPDAVAQALQESGKRRSTSNRRGTGLAGRFGGSGAKPLLASTPQVDATRPMRSSADLESFLQRATLEQRRQRQSATSGPHGESGLPPFLVGQAQPRQSFLGPTEGRPVADGTVQVRYKQHGGRGGVATGLHGSDGAPRGLADRDWEALGVPHLDHALSRVREWVSELCRQLIQEVDECDRWFAANDVASFDCSHSLNEVLQVTPAAAPPPAMGGWGGGGMAAAPPPQPQTISKQQALREHRAMIQRSDHRNFDTILRLDQRIALEVRLDVSGTFPESAQLSNAELNAQQQYVLQRLRTLAKQRTLASYHHGSGDADSWREGFPCDAHLLLHVVRTSVEGMNNYVRFAYQHRGADRSQDLAIYVGDTGEPYYYVRYRSATQEKLYPTRPGEQSLFEALLIFASVVHTFHEDVYGGVRGTMDLRKAGLVKVLREPRLGGRPAAWVGTF